MKNEHGLDTGYFKVKLHALHRDCDNYTTREMTKALDDLFNVARHQDNMVILEKAEITKEKP